MNELFRIIGSRRFIVYFVLMYVVWYGLSFFLDAVWQVVQTGYVFLLLQVYSPFLLLIFGWLYFRKYARNDWYARCVVAISWIVFSLLLSAILVPYVYGYTWEAVLNLRMLNSQWVNLAAIMVAGMLAAPSRSTPA